MAWRKFPVSLTELSIDTTLRCGQSFRWKRSEDGRTYSCALRGRLYSLRQDATHLHYQTLQPSKSHPTAKRKRTMPLTPRSERNGSAAVEEGEEEDGDTEAELYLHHYLNLGPNLGKLYEEWSESDANFRKKAPKFTGVRILRQDAWEALVGFICSSNNNIARICQMMDKLCVHYGQLIGHIDSQPFYDMPLPSALIGPNVEGHLRELGFGYRAKYLHQTALMITTEEKGWLDSLRNPESPAFGGAPASAGPMLAQGREGYRSAHEALLSLQGVGPKVADCVCLMGLGWGEAVPVDTHVWQIAQRDYKFGKGKHASLTKATYDAVGNHFRKLWGQEAGWAHSVLFTADLRAFSERLSAKIVDESTVAGSTNTKAVQVKIEIAPALPEAEEETGKPLLKTEAIIAVEAPNADVKYIPPAIKQEVAEAALLNVAMVPSEGRRRSKRQRRSA